MSHPEQEEPPLLPERHAGEGAFDAQLPLPLPAADVIAPFQTVIKRDGREEPFDRRKIAATIFKAAQAVGVPDRDTADSLASAVAIYLSKIMGAQPPTVDQVHDAVERVLIHMSLTRAALAYARHRDRRARIRRLREGDLGAVLGEIAEARSEPGGGPRPQPQPDVSVRTGGGRLAEWDRGRIVAALTLETGLDRSMAELVAAEVEEQIARAGIKTPTSSLVRELAGAKLVEHGLFREHDRHRRLGVPLYDTARLLRGRAGETLCGDPEATGRALARTLKKEYALSEVFSAPVAEAHLSGALHLHHADEVDRLHSAACGLDAVARHGVRLPGGGRFAGPARYPETLLAHWVRAHCQYGALFSGGVSWPAANVLLAPWLRGMGDGELRQFAGMMVYEFAWRALSEPADQSRAARMSLCWNTPPALRGGEAAGPGGLWTGGPWDAHLHDAQRLAWALVDALREGGDDGVAFSSPALAFELDAPFFTAPGAEDFLRHSVGLAEVRGSFDFALHRGAPPPMPRTVWHRVTLNLPRAACAAGGEAGLGAELDRLAALASRAHAEKRRFLEELLAAGARGPLSLLAEAGDGELRADPETGVFETAVTGLRECVELLGAPGDAEKLAMAGRILERLGHACREAGRRGDIRIELTADPSPETAARLAELDSESHPAAAAAAQTHPDTQALEYTPGCAWPRPESTPFDQARDEGALHPLLNAPVPTRLTLPLRDPSGISLADFVTKVFRQTGCAALGFE